MDQRTCERRRLPLGFRQGECAPEAVRQRQYACEPHRRQTVGGMLSGGNGCSRRHLEKIGANCRDIAGMFADFRDKTGGTAEACSLTYNTDSEFRIAVSKLEDVRREQAALLQQAVLLEEENCRLAQLILDGP